jgi:hypothetical protein
MADGHGITWISMFVLFCGERETCPIMHEYVNTRIPGRELYDKLRGIMCLNLESKN